jgi:hypothetical protein
MYHGVPRRSLLQILVRFVVFYNHRITAFKTFCCVDILNSVTGLETFGKDCDGETYFLPIGKVNNQKLKNLIQKFQRINQLITAFLVKFYSN